MSANGRASSTITCQSLNKQQVKNVEAGTILWLPRREKIPEGAEVDPDIEHGAFNHPCVVLSLPRKVNLDSTIEIAYITSKCKTLPSKNKSWRIRTSYLRIVTQAKPFAKDCLHFKDGMGMSRDYSSVFLKSFKISLRALELYGRGLAHVLTKQSLTKLLDAIESNSIQDGPSKKRHERRKAPTKDKPEVANPIKSRPKAQQSVSKVPSETPPIIVISDTDSELDGWVPPKTRLQKRLSVSALTKSSGNAEIPRKKFIVPDIYDDDDDDYAPLEVAVSRKRGRESLGSDDDDWRDERATKTSRS